MESGSSAKKEPSSDPPSLGNPASKRTSRNDQSSTGCDGSAERVSRRGQRPKFTGAIFVHAGAGFHSHQNERVHLEACNNAAMMGMRFLRSGASATEAVEAALRVLEDKEITNAGYGSNLSLDGVVECDATIVDYLGRSGACGAVPNVRNPICLAKLILDKSNQPLTLRRVPPNLLVGEGAKNFAEEHGMQTVPNEGLISKNARDRFLRWQEDLRRAEEKLRHDQTRKTPNQTMSCPSNSTVCQQYETSTTPPTDLSTLGSAQKRDHANAILTGTWNEGQTDSPLRGTPTIEKGHGQFPLPATPAITTTRVSAVSALDRAQNKTSTQSRIRNWTPALDHSQDTYTNSSFVKPSSTISETQHDGVKPQYPTIQVGQTEDSEIKTQTDGPRGTKRSFSHDEEEGEAPPMDMITDTVGAIAIDAEGHIAAGSSSGGIGMKHRGRIGPAALVGIGTAVVPSDPNDPDGVCVAAVTSGTGEHMATTIASQRCAERIYHSTCRGLDGTDVAEYNEDSIMESFIDKDFMGHPGVKNCNSVGAIGVMVVKKTRTGHYLYFAHNTDSFALASMGGSDKEPQCVMSRLGDTTQVTRGARKIRFD